MDENVYRRKINVALIYLRKAERTLEEALLSREEIIKKEMKEANDLEQALDALDSISLDFDERDKRKENLIKSLEDESPVLRIAYVILWQSIKDNVPEIQIYGDKVKPDTSENKSCCPESRRIKSTVVDYIIEGKANRFMSVPFYVYAPLISRLKIMAGLNIAERRREQEGILETRYEGKEYSFNVKTIPESYGEKVLISRKI